MAILDYIIWYYTAALRDFLEIWSNFLKFIWLRFFPIPQILKTLFSPWRRDIERYSGPGFDPKVYLKIFAFNLISRAIGFFIRLSAIIINIILESFLLLLGIIFLILWLLWPFLFLASIMFPDSPFLLIFLAFGLLTFIFYLNSREKPADQMSIKEIMGKKWAKIVWERVGLHVKEAPKEVLKNPEDNLENFLKKNKIKKEDFKTALDWEISRQREIYIKKRFWRKENLFSSRGFAKDWAFGFTPLLDKYSQPVSALAPYEKLIGRERELGLIERILSKGSQSNVLIVGEPGVGKTSLVQKFAHLVSSGQTLQNLAYRRVIFMDFNRAMAGLIATGEIEELLIKIFNQAKAAGNVILVIEDFHNLASVSARMGVGKKDLSQIIAPFLEGGFFQLIAVTTYSELHEQIERHGELMKFFEKVEVKEPDKETSQKICQDSVREIESKIPARITVQSIKEIVEKADSLISGTPFPEKAIDLLEETAIYVAAETSDYFVKPRHVDIVLSQKTEIPVGQLESSEKEKLLNLEKILHKRIIAQEQAISNIASAMRRSRLEVGEKKRPIGSFLFLGPTGVGKTETAKALAEAYFGSEERMNRFDMSEFQGLGAVEKAIGSRQGDFTGLLTTAVKENPFSLLLFDEIEKADYGVLNLFLQVLEEGWLTDAFGKKINFRNQIIIATSNAGAEFIRKKINENISEDVLKEQLTNHILEESIFRPEFLNRFDDIIVFKSLTHSHLLQIAELMLNKLKERLKKQNMIFNFSRDLIDKIAELGYDPANGARPMRRVIQKKVEDLIAKKILEETIQKDIPFEIRVEEIL